MGAVYVSPFGDVEPKPEEDKKEYTATPVTQR
jgi:hypothetical protein